MLQIELKTKTKHQQKRESISTEKERNVAHETELKEEETKIRRRKDNFIREKVTNPTTDTQSEQKRNYSRAKRIQIGTHQNGLCSECIER